MRETVRLTMAQALVKFLTKQYVSVDGEKSRFVRGVTGIFGHGNVVGIGQALEQYKDEIPFVAGKNEQEIAHAPQFDRVIVNDSLEEAVAEAEKTVAEFIG